MILWDIVLLTFFSPDVRRMICTTNAIESLNKKLRKVTENKQSFEKPDNLLDFFYPYEGM
jgi:transposase-like protein